MSETGVKTGHKAKANKTTFRKGTVKAGPGRGHKKPVASPGLSASLHADLVKAYTTGEQPDDSPGVKAARLLALNNYEKFLTLYAKLMPSEMKGQAEQAAKSEVAAVATELKPEPKEERVDDLIDRLLDEWNGEPGL